MKYSRFLNQQKKIIINADDFGLNEDINRCIIQCYREGIVTSSTIMANMPAFEDAIRLAKENPSLAIGVHLNLVEGKPVLPIDLVPSIVNNRGDFLTLPSLMYRLLFRRLNIADVKMELSAQIRRVAESGIEISHIDSHRHIHMHPTILSSIAELCQRYEIRKLRWSSDRFSNNKNFNFRCTFWHSSPNYSVKQILLNLAGVKCRKIISDEHLLTNDVFFEMLNLECENYIDLFEQFCQCMPNGTTELCCHPGYAGSVSQKIEFKLHDGERQIRILTDPILKQILQDNGIKLSNYRDL